MNPKVWTTMEEILSYRLPCVKSRPMKIRIPSWEISDYTGVHLKIIYFFLLACSCDPPTILATSDLYSQMSANFQYFNNERQWFSHFPYAGSRLDRLFSLKLSLLSSNDIAIFPSSNHHSLETTQVNLSWNELPTQNMKSQQRCAIATIVRVQILDNIDPFDRTPNIPNTMLRAVCPDRITRNVTATSEYK